MITWFKNRKTSTKLIIGFITVATLAGIVGLVGILNLITIGQADKTLYEENTLGLSYAGTAEVYYQRIRFNALKALLDDTAADHNDTIQNMRAYSLKVDEYLRLYEDGIITETDRQNFDALNQLWASYKEILEKAIDLIKQHKDDEAKPLILNDVAVIGNGLQNAFDTIFTYNSEGGKTKSDANQKLLVISIIIMIAVIVIAVVVSIILGRYISALIGKPIKIFAEFAKMLAVGDVDVGKLVNENVRRELTARKDEVGELARSFEQVIESTYEQAKCARLIAEGDLTATSKIRSDNDVLGKSLSDVLNKLNHIVETIVLASEQVSSGSDLVSNSSTALSQGASEQASSVQQLTASLEEIGVQIKQNAENADCANKLAKEAEENAVAGNTQMRYMLDAMADISESSKNINKIIKVIDDIAFQTNILALNAAVEAARAGQHGKGFAVVAEEVRNLAAKSASAAKETTELIEDSIRKVEAGTKLANNTAAALDNIVEQVKKAAELVNDIAVASDEQSVGVEQINQGVIQISQVVQSNAALSEESAAASEELSSQASQLKEIVGVFKLHKSMKTAGHDKSIQLADYVPNKDPAPNRAVDLKLISSHNDFGKY